MDSKKLLKKPDSFFSEFTRKGGTNLETTHYCPGCGHGILHKLIAEAIDDLGLQDKTILIGSVGCSVFIYYYYEVASISTAHGRAPAVGSAISRAHPDSVVISYQGDGDLAAIGTSQAIHAANRGENIIVFFVNNSNYGMTGGQLAPTTLLNQVTATTPYGRNLLNDGPPIKMSELIATLDAPILVARSSLSSPKNILQARKLIQRGLQAQKEHKGYVFLEFLAPCPTNWHKTPADACRWIDEEVEKVFPLGIFKDIVDQKEPQPRLRKSEPFAAVMKELGLDQGQSLFEPFDFSKRAEYRIKIAGFGGQGVLSLGLAMANLGMRKGLQVTWLPSYGPEMRGGVANCSVVLSRNPIGSPVVEKPDLLVAMNKPSLFAFGSDVDENGAILYNSSMTDELPEGLNVVPEPVDASNLAIQAGNLKVANTVFLAAFAKRFGLFSHSEIQQYVEELFPSEKVQKLNLAALDAGWNSETECKLPD